MADVSEAMAAAMAKRGFKPIADEDLAGYSIDDIKCRACSGYGNCGFKTFRLYDGTPYSVCNLRFDKLKGGDEPTDADEATDADAQ